jgi:dipeptidyl aminopeptidase/acylaminoacyl peptidase
MTDHYLEALLNLPELERPWISRDGKWAAWTWYRMGPAADVYAAPTDGSQPPLRLTQTSHDTVLISWTPSSRSVLVYQDRDGDERAQLFRVDLDRPGHMQPLTEESPRFFLRGGQLHPNERWLFYGANWDERAGQEIEATWLYRHDLESGERMPIAQPQRGCSYIPRLNERGTHILYRRNDRHPAGLQVWLVDVEGREDREIVNAGPESKAHATWIPGRQQALVLAEAQDYQRVGIWDLASDRIQWLIDDAERCIESAWVPHGSRQAVIVEPVEARTRVSLLDVDTGQENPLSEVPDTLVPLAPVGDDAWVGSHYSSQQPADVVRFLLTDGEAQDLTSLTRVWDRTPLQPNDLAQAEDFRWRSVDGLEIQGWLYRARGQARGTIVKVHGGPTWHIEDWIDPQVQYLVSQGFHVLLPNYRGSTGFGLAYREAIKVDGWGGREQEDIRTGIEALIATGLAVPGKIGITGTSYGGYSAWWAITHFPPELVAAAAPICGMTDLIVDWRTTRPDLRTYSEEMMGGAPHDVPERYRERSPLHSVANIRGKLLIVQGLQDPNVTPENVRVVEGALEQAGIPYKVLAFSDEGHGIGRPRNQRILYSRLAQFFGRAFSDS